MNDGDEGDEEARRLLTIVELCRQSLAYFVVS